MRKLRLVEVVIAKDHSVHPRGSDSRARAPGIGLCRLAQHPRISCMIHGVWRCAQIAFLEKEEIVIDCPFSVE